MNYVPLYLRERQPLQGQKRPEYVLSHSLRFLLGLSPDLAVDREPRVRPACNLLHQSLRDELLPKEKSEDLPGEKLSNQAAIKTLDIMEAAILVLSPFCHQEVDIEAVTRTCKPSEKMKVAITKTKKVKTKTVFKDLISLLLNILTYLL